MPAGLCTTDALQKWLSTPESVRYSTPTAGVPPKGLPTGEPVWWGGESTVEPGFAAPVAPAGSFAAALSADGSGEALSGAVVLVAAADAEDEAGDCAAAAVVAANAVKTDVSLAGPPAEAGA
ncbi:hypothetical protein GCM10009838_08660 [Catenulispora subtropica]|uniref:Uncharacterized protein n=1 Tax=Catenulispora subtropica TaxID=450798 RepID=A0ABN2QMV3_9ACTN